MKVIRHDLGRERKVFVFADTHFGNPGLDIDKLQRHIDLCDEEGIPWIHLGDWVEGITPKDRRFDARSSSTVADEYREARRIFEPIKDLGICMLAGNHDDYISRTYGDFMVDLSDFLDMPYLGYSGFVILQLDSSSTRKAYTLYLHHGHGAGRLIGARAINLQRLSGKFEADIYMMGHTHTYLQHADEYIGLKSQSMRNPKIEKRYRYFVNVPSYFETYIEGNNTNYGERAAFYPQVTGGVLLEFSHHRTLERRQHVWNVSIRPVLE